MPYAVLALSLLLALTASNAFAQLPGTSEALEPACALVEGPPDQEPVCCQRLLPDLACGVSATAASCEEAGGIALPACLCCALAPVEGECTGEATACGVGECQAAGAWECQAGVLVDTCVPGSPQPEICDGRDNDCDGATDEDTGGPLCDDGNPCTEDTCGSAGQCTFVPSPGRACTDGNACTVADTCDPSGACSGRPISCDDGDPCTVDTCDPHLGCRHELNPFCSG